MVRVGDVNRTHDLLITNGCYNEEFLYKNNKLYVILHLMACQTLPLNFAGLWSIELIVLDATKGMGPASALPYICLFLF
jgi:hypothetical protein